MAVRASVAWPASSARWPLLEHMDDGCRASLCPQPWSSRSGWDRRRLTARTHPPLQTTWCAAGKHGTCYRCTRVRRAIFCSRSTQPTQRMKQSNTARYQSTEERAQESLANLKV